MSLDKDSNLDPARVNMQVHLPYTTREKIQTRAEKVGKSLSEYLRDILTLLYTPELAVDKEEVEI